MFGLVLYAQEPPSLRVKLLTKYARITNTFPSADGEHYHGYISRLQTKFDAIAESVNNKQLTFDTHQPSKIEELLGAVLPVDDSSLQFGPVHGGMTHDVDYAFEDLYKRFVEAHLPMERENTRDEGAIWRLFSRPLKENMITHQLRSTIIKTPRDDIEFDHAWKNGRWNALQPISFDLLHAGNIRRKSHEWFTANVLINNAPDVASIYYLLGKPQSDELTVIKAYQKAKDLLGTGDFSQKVEVIEEDQAQDFAKTIARRIIADTEHSEGEE